MMLQLICGLPTHCQLLSVVPKLSLTPKSTASYQINVSRGVCVDSSVVTVSVSSNPVITEVDTSNYRDANIIVNPATGTQPYYYMVDEGTYAANALIENLLLDRIRLM